MRMFCDNLGAEDADHEEVKPKVELDRVVSEPLGARKTLVECKRVELLIPVGL